MSDFLDKMMQKAKGFDWDGPAEKFEQTEEQAVEHDQFDELAYDMLSDSVPALKRSIKNVANEYDYVPPAYEDLFNLLHQGDPEFVDERTMKEGYDANHEMLAAMAQSEEFKELRKQTAFDEYATAFTMLSMEDEIKDAFERTKQAREHRAEMEKLAQQAAQQMQQAMQQGQQAQGGTDPAAQAAAAQALQNAMNNMEEAKKRLQEAREQQTQAAQEAGQSLSSAADSAQKDLNEETENASAYGVGDGELRMMPYEERRALTAKLNHGKMAQLAKLIGQWREYSDAERRRKVVQSASEVFDVELGSNLAKLINTEINTLAIPELEELFWLRFAEQGLMQWMERGPKTLGKGPILVVCDESGSMGAPVDSEGNTREMWSKAISMSLADQARRGKRDFTYIGFSSYGQQWISEFPGGETPIDKVIQFVSHFFAGGTEYTAPLTMAMQIVREAAENGRPQPDIVFITDDDCSVPEEFVKQWEDVRQELGMTVYGIQIGGSSYHNTMRRLADRCIDLSQVNSNPEGMTELFRTI